MDPRGHAWAYYLVPGLLASGAYFALGSSPFLQGNVYDIIGLSGALAILVGVRLHRPSLPSAWYLIAAGQLLFVAGDVTWNIFEFTLHRSPFPSVADVFYVAGYPFLAVGLLRQARARRGDQDRAALIDASIVATGVGLLIWALLIDPYVDDASLTGLELFFSVAYPLGDVLILAVGARLAFGGTTPNHAFRLLGLSLVALLAADLVYAYQILHGPYVSGSPLDALYLVSYVTIGAAGLHQGMLRLSTPDQATRPRVAHGRLVLLAGAAFLCPAVWLIQGWRALDAGDVPIIAGTSAILFLLVVARLRQLVGEVESKAEALDRQGRKLRVTLEELRGVEADRRRLLQRTLRAAEEERMRVAADLHDGPIQRLATMSYGLERARLRAVRGDSHDAVAVIERLQQEMSSEVQGLRQLMAALRPPALDEQGLEGALRDQVRMFSQRTGMEVAFDSSLDARLDPEIETVIYRVAQEALVNVSKHSGAWRVQVGLAAVNGSVELAVEDDGSGFDVSRAPEFLREGHFGLVAMREQVEMAGGTWSISSRNGLGATGTTVKASFPREQSL